MHSKPGWLSATVLTFALTATVFAQAPSPSKAPAKKRAAASASTSTQEIQELRLLVTSQQQQLETQNRQIQQVTSRLQQLLDAQKQSDAAKQTAADQARAAALEAQKTADQAKQAADQASANAAEVKTALVSVNTKGQDELKRLGALEGLTSRFRFVGDIRVRGESFFQDGVADRNRARVRVRFGVEGKLSDDFVGGLSLATGTLGDPTTTNETFTNFYDRKTVALDKGYIAYQPTAARWVQVTAGKFAYTWNRTPVTGDTDINPEGFTEKFSWDLKTPFVKNLSFQGIETLLNEVTAGTDSYTLGGQVSGKIQIGRWTSTPSFLLLKWDNPDAILQASAFAVQYGGTTANPAPGEGPGCAKGSGLPTAPPCAFSPNGMTNSTYTDPAGKPHFYSQWLYADFILNNQIKTPWDRFPVNLLLEYENNLDAKDHPLAPTGNLNVLTSLGSQSHAYLADFSLGQSKNRNDIQVGYAWLRQEQDAVLASFAESDQRAPTNILQNKIYGTWKVRANTSAGYTLWIGRTLNSNLQHATLPAGVTAGQTEPYLKRMQFDLIYAF